VEKLDQWPEVIRLVKRPVQSVTSIYYVNSGGNSTLLATSEYSLDVHAAYATIVPTYNVDWPSTLGHYGDITITYVAGYNGASNVPQVWKQAMLLLISHWFENRSSVNIGNITNELPHAYEALAANYMRASYP
jgi:uncharacterized phiE125 gp8 family phage protein